MNASHEAPRLPSELIYRRIGAGYVALRPLLPGDAPALRAMVRALSPQSRYRRFHAPIVELSPAATRALTEVDHVGHVAWGAFSSETIGGAERALVGEARFIRHADRPDTAELGIAVHDPFQRKGVGAALLQQVMRDAAARGIRKLTAEVVHGNVALMLLLSRFGAVRVTAANTVDIDVTPPPLH